MLRVVDYVPLLILITVAIGLFLDWLLRRRR